MSVPDRDLHGSAGELGTSDGWTTERGVGDEGQEGRYE